MEPTEEQLAQLKVIELEMLKQFVAVCGKLNLKYYLLAGTLLGAVRHKGFIPWDDDIDVGMPRADYEIFIKEAQQYLEDKYFVQTFHTDPEFPANFCKIRNSETTFVETSVKNCKINHGVYIDIFPLDVYPYCKRQHKCFQLKKTLLNVRVAEVFFLPKQKRKKTIKSFIAKSVTIFLTPLKAIKMREKMYTKYKDGAFLVNHSGAWGIKEITPKDWYGEGVDLEFEGLRVKAPTKWHEWLTQVYGNYMEFPPVEKRIGHHYTEIVDLEKSYLEYYKEV